MQGVAGMLLSQQTSAARSAMGIAQGGVFMLQIVEVRKLPLQAVAQVVGVSQQPRGSHVPVVRDEGQVTAVAQS
jgi:hypothetical protein